MNTKRPLLCCVLLVLTDRTIEAAKKIKFIPATKGGKYVSMWIQLEYNFNLY